MGFQDTRGAVSATPSIGRWACAIGATTALAPWFSVGGILIVVGMLTGMDLPHGPLSALLIGLLAMYGLGFVPSLLSVAGFAIVYGRYRSAAPRQRLKWTASLIGATASVGCVALFEALRGGSAAEILGVSSFYGLNGATAGYFGSTMFMAILDGPETPGRPEPPANWHR